jgi:hypothetical protein
MKPRKISDVLWLAANKHLAHDPDLFDFNKATFSCDAVYAVFSDYDDPLHRRTMDFLRELGCNTKGHNEFKQFEKQEGGWRSATKKAQGARYLWLMFAYLVARSERK